MNILNTGVDITGAHFKKMYRDLYERGKTQISDKCHTIELLNYAIEVPAYDYLTSFADRKLNLDYCKAEWAWYLRGDRYDTSIEDHATLWKKIKCADGGFNSNYGQYIFGEDQFEWCLSSLLNDRHSRQASMQLLNKSHMYNGNPDVVCTHGINFQIRDNRLNMTVMMRSNDAIFGTTNDVFCFGQLLIMMHSALREKYSGLEMGTYTHFACSLHVYERHFDMLEKLALSKDDFSPIDYPLPKTPREFNAIATNRRDSNYDYANWVLDFEGK